MTLRSKNILLLTFCLVVVAYSQVAAQSKQSVKKWFQDQYHYINPDLVVPDDSLEKLSKNWNTATDEMLAANQRHEALKTLIQTMVNIQGAQQYYSANAITALAGRYRQLDGLRIPPDNRRIEGSTKSVSYNRVQTVGNGDTDVILLSDIFADVSIYEPLMEEGREYFTFHPLNLPGLGDMPPLALPESREYLDAPWFSQIELAIADYVKENSITKPVIVGIWGSGYLAVQLALNHPDLFSKAVVINAPINIFFGLTPTNPTGLSPVQTRIAYFKAQIPSVFPSPDSETQQANARGRSGFYTSKDEALPELIRTLSQPSPIVVQQYIGELFSQDYFADLGDISIPLLSINSASMSDGLTASSVTPYLIGEWEKVRFSHKDVPISQVILEDTRIYLPLDTPVEIADILRNFQEGRIIDPIDGDPSTRRYQLSARNTLRGMIGATPIEIDYGSPSIRGRKNIYGNLVAYDRPWRAGANHITVVEFYKDVIIDGQHIPKGKYGFFVIPREAKPWEIAFTKYSSGAAGGTFGYDSTYKMVSVQVGPIDNNPEEYLRYFVEQRSPLHGVIGFTWAGKRVEIEVETPVHIQAISQTLLSSVPRAGWKELGAEKEPDASNPDNADARQVQYRYDRNSGMIWFRIVLQKKVDHTNIGMNLVLDIDQDQRTGAGWWGRSNSLFTYDRVGTLWVRKTGTGKYAGTIGISRYEYIMNNGDLTHDAENNFRFSVDEEQNMWYVGVPLDDLDPDGKFDINIAVGTSSSWNDDLPNSGSLAIDLTETLN